MDFSRFIDLFLHLDKHLANVVDEYGIWIYALIFLIIFVETGLVVMPFLPGDSLLFVAGAIAAIGKMSLPVLMVSLSIAAILGDSVNYWIGRRFSDKVFSLEGSRWFNREAFDRAHAFYEKHGPITIIVARFMPFVRTFIPFVGGMAKMTYPRFMTYNVIGGLVWVISLTGLGYLIGNSPWVQEHFSLVALALIVVPSLPAVVELIRHGVLNRRKGEPRA